MNTPGWAFDPSNDFPLADGVESVTVARQSSDGTYSPPGPGRAIWENPTMKNTAGVVGVDRVWHLHGPDFLDSPVLPGDVLTGPDGQQWVVARSDVGGVNDELTLQCVRHVGGRTP